MRHIHHIFITILLAMAIANTSMAASRRYTLQTMKRVFAYAASIDTVGRKPHDSYAYLKYDIRTNKRNALLLAVPTMFAVANGGDREHVGENYSRIVSKRPGDFETTRLLDRSTIPHQMRTMPTVLKYLTPLIYEEMLIDGRLLSPFHYINRRFYRYRVTEFSHGTALVSFRPRLKNTKLVRGWARVETESGRVIETAFDGEYDMVRFHVAVTMGDSGVNSLMPNECNLNARFLFLGNDLTAEYTSVYNLPKIINDTITNQRDTALINRIRPIPLTSHEQYLFDRYYARRNRAAADSTQSDRKKAKIAKRLWDVVGRNMIQRTNQKFGTHDQGQFRVSPILNPLYFSYSSRRGLTYKLDIRGSYYFNNRQMLELRFKSGYAFKQKQFYFDFPFTFYFDRRHDAYLRTEWSSGRQMTSSEVVDAIKNERGDSINWDKLNLTYFRDHSFKAVIHYDPTPHWGLETGIAAHKRTAIDHGAFQEAGKPTAYTSVAPIFELTYRPWGYYGPIFTGNYERGIRGLLGSDTDYERLELDGQYNYRLSGLSSLQMRAGTGFYTHKGKRNYFLDYANFHEENIPGGWNDEWACSFELLNRGWYNASEYYVRANVAYETPLLLMAWVPIAGRLIEKERVYINALSVRHLHPYVEYGYGFTCRAFSLAAFLAQRNWEIEGFTVRFGFELFRHW